MTQALYAHMNNKRKKNFFKESRKGVATIQIKQVQVG
jgi:hypothetical protein